MFYSILSKIDKLFSFKEVKAHCDIPCGIYDPIPAQIAAMTVARMMDTISELDAHESKEHNNNKDMHYQNKIGRMIAEKERSAELIKHEVRIIWGDFFKEPQFKDYPDIHNLVHEIMLLASKCKQNVNVDFSRDLVDKLNSFAEIFWKIKQIEYARSNYHCMPNLEIVLPKY
ncbi:MAG: superoxide dismutase, Ni [Pelagibacterales bacterium]|nr:superoxide dismutase, Ni [Pelagibacterales bacterium]PPR15934.1 MAG: Superoxide dismutase [Ni] [Alphaproteobacteria bacterium MarineAlpha9_Bin3]|tara:strand:+ start:1901 stop:2416 length:516 start_codon:yes stop_codon:yes gene_type:complete